MRILFGRDLLLFDVLLWDVGRLLKNGVHIIQVFEHIEETVRFFLFKTEGRHKDSVSLIMVIDYTACGVSSFVISPARLALG